MELLHFFDGATRGDPDSRLRAKNFNAKKQSGRAQTEEEGKKMEAKRFNAETAETRKETQENCHKEARRNTKFEPRMKQPRGFNQKDADKKIRRKEEDKMMGGKMMKKGMLRYTKSFAGNAQFLEIALRRSQDAKDWRVKKKQSRRSHPRRLCLRNAFYTDVSAWRIGKRSAYMIDSHKTWP